MIGARLSVNVQPLLAGPYVLLSGARSQDEGTAGGTALGTLSVANGSGVYTYTKTVDADSAFTLTVDAITNAIVYDYETATSHTFTVTADNGVDPVITASFTVQVNDIAAPVLSAPTATATGTTTADLTADTDVGNGTIYAVVTQSATPPSAAQIAAGHDENDVAADFAGNAAVVGTGTQTISASLLTASTAYHAYLMHTGLPSEQSNVVTASFTTNAP